MSALDGIRVLDLTRLLPGPFCTQLLADLGADVIKVEEPGGGDPARQSSPRQGDTGALFLLVNRNKRSLRLDLKTAEGRELLLRLVEQSDVLVESFRPGVMERLALGYAVLAARNPRLIYATLSGFGLSGPYRDRAGHDVNYLALAGVLGFNADGMGRPVLPAVQVADLGGGTLAAVAILAALVSRQQTGRGQSVDVSLFGSAFAWLPTLLASLFGLDGPLAAERSLFAHGPLTDGPPRPARDQPPAADSSPPMAPEGRHATDSGQALPHDPAAASARPRRARGRPPLAGGLAQYGVYPTADGRHVTLGALEPKFLANFLARVGRPELAALASGDVHQRAAFRRQLEAIFGARTMDEWVELLGEVDTCFAPVLTLEETLRDPQVEALGLFTSVDHPRLGQVPQIAPPFTLSNTPAGIHRPPPDLGEHSAEILTELLNLSAADVRALADREII